MFAHFPLQSFCGVRIGNIAVKTCTNVDICRLTRSLHVRLALNLSGNGTKLGGARGKNPQKRSVAATVNAAFRFSGGLRLCGVMHVAEKLAIGATGGGTRHTICEIVPLIEINVLFVSLFHLFFFCAIPTEACKRCIHTRTRGEEHVHSGVHGR